MTVRSIRGFGSGLTDSQGSDRHVGHQLASGVEVESCLEWIDREARQSTRGNESQQKKSPRSISEVGAATPRTDRRATNGQSTLARPPQILFSGQPRCGAVKYPYYVIGPKGYIGAFECA